MLPDVTSVVAQTLRQQVSAEAHKQLPHANPLSVVQMSQLVDMVLARRPSSALEIGCGAGEFSIALARRQDVHVIALDTNPYVLERALAAAAATTLIGEIDFRQCPAAEYVGAPVDLVVCIGSSHALGTPRQALQTLRQRIHPSGTLVFAELNWSAKPSPDFLRYLGASEDDYWAVESSEKTFAEAGLNVEAKLTATAESWANYEAGVLRGRLEFAKTLPTDEATQVIATSTEWHRVFEQHGMHCLGFSALVATRSGS